MTIDIDVARTADCTDLLSALEAKGLHGMVLEGDGRVWLRIADDETNPQGMQTQVLDAIDAWVVGLELPLVVTPLADNCYSVHPPGD